MQFIGEGLEETTMSSASTSASLNETSSLNTTVEDCLPSLNEMTIGDGSGAGSSMEQRSEYFSARVEEMMRSKSQFSSNVEHEIAHSRVHWSKVPHLSGKNSDSSENSENSENSEDDDHEEDEDHEDEELTQENRKVFAELMNDPQWGYQQKTHFFQDSPSFVMKLGRQIAEGGQGTIFEVLHPNGDVFIEFLLKVFKRGSHLSDLKKQWPHGILRRELNLCVVLRGIILDDGRFAFLLFRCWGDLRKLIDQAMQEKNNQGPPFPYEWKRGTLLAKDIILPIAIQMFSLHKQGIIHRDLKAANILLSIGTKYATPIVADYECSFGVIGTRFWRAPEILLALKNRSAINFIEKMDVYSFGMTCFEIVTGRLPFEGELEVCRDSNDLVIAGQRPKLPSDLDVAWKDLIERCWNPIPNERPSFEEIIEVLEAL